MSDDLRIIIVSHKRWDRQLTLRYLPNAEVCVPESQVDMYREHNPGIRILAHPDSVIGLAPKRDWIIQNFAPVFMVDDDLTYIQDGMWPKTRSIRDGEFIEGIIRRSFDMAREMGVKLWGFSEGKPPQSFNPQSPIKFNRFVHGGCMGVDSDSGLWINHDIKHYDDLWLTCLNAYMNRLNFVDDRYGFVLGAPEASIGGNADNRQALTIKHDAEILRKTFGADIVVKRRAMIAVTRSGTSKKVKFKSVDPRSEFHVSFRSPF